MLCASVSATTKSLTTWQLNEIYPNRCPHSAEDNFCSSSTAIKNECVFACITTPSDFFAHANDTQANVQIATMATCAVGQWFSENMNYCETATLLWSSSITVPSLECIVSTICIRYYNCLACGASNPCASRHKRLARARSKGRQYYYCTF